MSGPFIVLYATKPLYAHFNNAPLLGACIVQQYESFFPAYLLLVTNHRTHPICCSGPIMTFAWTRKYKFRNRGQRSATLGITASGTTDYISRSCRQAQKGQKAAILLILYQDAPPQFHTRAFGDSHAKAAPSTPKLQLNQFKPTCSPAPIEITPPVIPLLQLDFTTLLGERTRIAPTRQTAFADAAAMDVVACADARTSTHLSASIRWPHFLPDANYLQGPRQAAEAEASIQETITSISVATARERWATVLQTLEVLFAFAIDYAGKPEGAAACRRWRVSKHTRASTLVDVQSSHSEKQSQRP